jgi:pseudaminic acid cytidylyltransferase
MANLAIIPARGGSKRIPKKNIKEFNGKPILAYTIETLISSEFFDEIMVSTDDLEIANVALEYGAKIPFMRTDSKSDDFATLAEVIIEVIEQYKIQGKAFESVCCILPTAALITSEKIIEAFDILNFSKFSSVVPVIRYAYPIQRALEAKNSFLNLRDKTHLNTRSQDLEPTYHDAGQFYWLNVKEFLIEKKIFTDNTGFLELKEYEAQDVDTPDDWKMLELKYNFKN